MKIIFTEIALLLDLLLPLVSLFLIGPTGVAIEIVRLPWAN